LLVEEFELPLELRLPREDDESDFRDDGQYDGGNGAYRNENKKERIKQLV